MNTNLMVDLLSSTSLAQSASQYPTKSWGGNHPKRNLNFKVFYKYQKMRLITIQCFRLRLAMCIMLIRYAKSGQVHDMAYMKDPIACW
jgi:hypothetical protein